MTDIKKNLNGSVDQLAKAFRNIFAEAVGVAQESINNRFNGIDKQLVAIKSQVDHHQAALDSI